MLWESLSSVLKRLRLLADSHEKKFESRKFVKVIFEEDDVTDLFRRWVGFPGNK
jgi:hypothetical protein